MLLRRLGSEGSFAEMGAISMATESNMIGSYRDLLDLIMTQGVLCQSLPAESAVQIPTQWGELDGILLIRWQESDGVIQFIQSLPMTIPPERMAAMAEAITRLNHGLALPGFDLAHEDRSVAFRQLLPLVPRGQVLPQEIMAMFRMTVRNAALFLPALRAVAGGQAQAQTILDDAMRLVAQVIAAAPPAKSP